MDKSALVLAAAVAAAVIYNMTYVPPLSETGEKVLVYVGARDCGPCREFESRDRSRLIAAARSKGWRYQEYISPSLSVLNDPNHWPASMRWVYTGAHGVSGTPTFLLFDDRKLKRTVTGWRGLEQQMDKLS
ncbi:hypothetical protein [Chthonobacter albigriseus]|uniref:hypothetical protein n=1 Tax=Chthonobacter albigriseus TaxID=1683161 RepID=UPI0015EEDC87|nr:hypothetical protein [Chthonobacter albigriseus]